MTQLPTFPTVVLVGRANVGKSTLFNKVIEKKKALISDIAGTTRDINTGIAYWNGINFELQDTGGIETIVSKKKMKQLAPKENIDYGVDILKRSQDALEKADVIIFVVDGSSGVQPADKELAKNLLKYDAKVFFAANKVDTPQKRADIYDFNKLGIGEPWPISGKTGLGVGDLLDEVTNYLKEEHHIEKDISFTPFSDIQIAMLGRPNVGKSSLFNSLIKEEKAIVSDVEHTTREPNDTTILYDNQAVTFIDTAGIRRKAKVEKGIESMSVSKTIDAVKRADIVLFVLDISQPITTQDKHLAEILLGSDVGIIIVANKWDLIEDKHTNIQRDMEKDLFRTFPFLTMAPVVFVSAKTGQHTQKLFETIFKVQQHRNIEVPQETLDRFIIKATKKHKPVAQTGIRRPTILDFEQIKTGPPVFRIRIRPTDSIDTTYLRYLENSLRSELRLEGTKLWITVKK